MKSMTLIPTHIEPLSPSHLHLRWSSGVSYSLPYVEIRYLCPCASCVDEHTGERTIERSQVQTTVHPQSVHLIGKYAIQFSWSDGHDTGMYHFERLWEICQAHGKEIPQRTIPNEPAPSHL
jgi:DUF971 family protein